MSIFFSFIWVTFKVKLTTASGQKLSPWVTAHIIFSPQAYWSIASQGSMHTNDRSLGNSLNGKPLKSAQVVFAIYHDKICEFEEALIICLVCHLWVVGAVVSRTQQPLSQHISARLPEHGEPSRDWEILAFYSFQWKNTALQHKLIPHFAIVQHHILIQWCWSMGFS